MTEPSFHLSFSVQESDIDPLGHANNIAYVRWVQDAAVAHSDAVGFDYDAYTKLGGIFVIRRHEVDYLRPVLRGERLDARTWVCRVLAARCERATEIVRTSDGAVVAKAMTVWVFIDQTTGRPARIPASVRDAFQKPVTQLPDHRPWPGA